MTNAKEESAAYETERERERERERENVRRYNPRYSARIPRSLQSTCSPSNGESLTPLDRLPAFLLDDGGTPDALVKFSIPSPRAAVVGDAAPNRGD